MSNIGRSRTLGDVGANCPSTSSNQMCLLSTAAPAFNTTSIVVPVQSGAGAVAIRGGGV